MILTGYINIHQSQAVAEGLPELRSMLDQRLRLDQSDKKVTQNKALRLCLMAGLAQPVPRKLEGRGRPQAAQQGHDP